MSCGPCLIPTEFTRRLTKDKFDTLTIPDFISKKGRRHGAHHGHTEAQCEYRRAKDFLLKQRRTTTTQSHSGPKRAKRTKKRSKISDGTKKRAGRLDKIAREGHSYNATLVGTVPNDGGASQVVPFSARPAHLGCRLVVHHVDVPLELARKSDLELVEAALDVLFPDLLMPSLTSLSRPCQHSLVRWLVGHLIDVGLGHVSSICMPPQASQWWWSLKPSPNCSHCFWLSHCVDVSVLPLCSCHRGGCHAGGWHVVHEAARLTTIFLSCNVDKSE